MVGVSTTSGTVGQSTQVTRRGGSLGRVWAEAPTDRAATRLWTGRKGGAFVGRDRATVSGGS